VAAPHVTQVCDGVVALTSPSAKSLVIPTVSWPMQSAAQGEHPVIGIVHAGSAKPRTLWGGAVQALAALRYSPKTWVAWLHQWRANLRELCSDSAIGSKRLWPAASVGRLGS